MVFHGVRDIHFAGASRHVCLLGSSSAVADPLDGSGVGLLALVRSLLGGVLPVGVYYHQLLYEPPVCMAV